MKEKFNRAQYTSRRHVMHCRTKEEFDAFLTYLDGIGEKWRNNSYLGMSYLWDISETNTVLYFNNGDCGVSSCYTAKTNGYIILEYSDFDWGAEAKNEFTFNSLQTGDIALRRDGETMIFVKELVGFITKDHYYGLSSYENDLTSMCGSEYDIIAVRRPINPHQICFDAFEYKVCPLVYERKEEPEEMTLAEVCKLLGKEIKIIK